MKRGQVHAAEIGCLVELLPLMWPGNRQRHLFALHQLQRFLGIERRLQHEAAAARQRPAERLRKIAGRSEEHTSELQSLMRISYAVFCLKKKKERKHNPTIQRTLVTYHDNDSTKISNQHI